MLRLRRTLAIGTTFNAGGAKAGMESTATASVVVAKEAVQAVGYLTREKWKPRALQRQTMGCLLPPGP